MATTLEQNILEAQPRESGTKNQARRVRREGKIPAWFMAQAKMRCR